MSAAKLHNRTRQSTSLPDKLRRKGRWLEIAILHVLELSDLAREGLENSGSYRFADHIYRNEASGKGIAGTVLDRLLLSLPAVRSFRNRYFAARDEVAQFLISRASSGSETHIVSAPCGLPRELAEAAQIALRHSRRCLDKVHFHGVDLDPQVLRDARAFALERGLPRFTTHQGDALDPASYPAQIDYITCTGLAEFLDDSQLVELYAVFHLALGPGGRLFSSGMRRLRVSDYLLELVELHTHYRSPDVLKDLALRAGFQNASVRMDGLAIQSLLLAHR